jgi:hypothetical protein
MENEFRSNRASYFSIPLSLLIIVTSVGGIFFKRIYARETLSYAAQGVAQDIFDLSLVVPTLIITALLIGNGKRSALFVWLGTMLYTLYTFVIYCFGVHFNALFLVYCLTLGLSFYSIVTVLLKTDLQEIKGWFDNKKTENLISIFLMILGLLFYATWLKEVIPAIIRNDIPRSVIEAGLPTNPVHVLDLSIFLPGVFIASILLKKKSPLGYLFAPSLLVFVILTAIAIGGMVVAMKLYGMEVDLRLSMVFAVLAIMSMLVLVGFLRHMKRASEPETA